MTGRRRVLCVAPSYPWPADDGYLQRLGNIIEALTGVGDIDYLWLKWIDRDIEPRGDIRLIEFPLPMDGPIKPSPRRLIGPLPWRVQGNAPIDPTPVLEQIAGPYDLVFCSHVDIWWLSRTWLPDAPTIVDFNDLMHLMGRDLRGFRRVVATRDARKWDRLQRLAASEVDAVMVCSELDVVRSGCPNAVAAANGYELTRTPPATRPDPTPGGGELVMVGSWSYAPNSDGAEWFVREVLPLVRDVRPQLVTRFVGRHVDRLETLRGLPGVDLVGEVADVGPELDRADLSIVPLLSGGGTRLKALEAFANRVPVVSTHKGIEGIDCEDRREVLLGDTPQELAGAILEALDDHALRTELVTNAAALFERAYKWSSIRDGIVALAHQVIDGAPIGSAGTVPNHRR